MSRKTLISLIISAIVLIAGISVAVSRLYSSDAPEKAAVESGHFLENHPLVKAIPSDAAMVLCFKDFRRAAEYLGDSISIYRKLASDRFKFISEASFPSLRKCPATMSVHYSKDIPPLFVIKCPEGAVKEAVDTTAAADTSADVKRLFLMAKEEGLVSCIEQGMILISTSETVITSSARHIREGHSVLEANGFTQAAASAHSEEAIFVNNAYMGKLMEVFAGKKHQKHSTFFKENALWTVFETGHRSSKEKTFRGSILYGEDPACYFNILEETSSESTVAEAVPAHTAFVASLPVKDIKEYLKAWRSYLDAKVRLDTYDAGLEDQTRTAGKSAEDWARAFDIKEVAVVGADLADSYRQVLLVKSGHKKHQADSSWNFQGFVSTLFGGIFSVTEEETAQMNGQWLVIGSKSDVKEYSDKLVEEGSLKDCLSDNGLGDRMPGKTCGFWMYYSLTEDPSLMDSNFSPFMTEGFKDVIAGAPFVPVTLALIPEDGRMVMDIALDRTSITKSKVPPQTVDRDTSVTVPEGPFKVTNSGTGQVNHLYQNSHLSICLQDESGKDLWGVPFKKKFCGFVQDVDYYNNGKIQFLFAAGSELYMIDRLGRFVSGFPVDLGKEIVLGPVAYDFTGAKGYTAVVVYKDNTVGYIDLHGKTVSGWNGITPDETIKFIPELLEAGKDRYWIVRTSRQAMVYPFLGGEPLVKGEGNKTIMPDSPFEIDGDGEFKARCYDGKDRSFKMSKK